VSGRTKYILTHWGKRGPVADRILGAPDPRAGELVELGQLVEIAYRTEKLGDGGPTIYEHKFRAPYPYLAFNSTGLVICGGGYRIGMRGIIG
jgi:hypothetical protein